MNAPALRTPWAHTHLSTGHAVGLVALVLAAHIALLSGSPSWLSPMHDAPQQTRAFETRQIVREHAVVAPAAPRSSRPEPVRPSRPTTSLTPTTPVTPEDPATPAAAFVAPEAVEAQVHALTAPVQLPERVAEAVDLPPYNRPRPASPELVEPTAFKPPASAVLHYSVTGVARHFNYFASAELQWRQDGQSYQAQLEVGAFLLGSRTQTSRGSLGPDGLSPTRFGDKNRTELAAHFQRDKGVISFSANTPEVPLLRGAQDRLSVVLQLSALLAADPERFPLGTMLSFQTVSQREAEVWQFAVEKTESLSLPYGTVSALKLNRKPRREFDQQIELWFAPELDYLPVRLRITNANGDQVDQQLRGLER